MPIPSIGVDGSTNHHTGSEKLCRIQVEMSFLCRVAGCTLRDRARSSVTWEGLKRGETLHTLDGLLAWEFSQLGSLHDILCGSECPTDGGICMNVAIN